MNSLRESSASCASLKVNIHSRPLPSCFSPKQPPQDGHNRLGNPSCISRERLQSSRFHPFPSNMLNNLSCITRSRLEGGLHAGIVALTCQGPAQYICILMRSHHFILLFCTSIFQYVWFCGFNFQHFALC